MQITITSNLEAIIKDIDLLDERKDRVAMYNAMSVPAARVLKKKFEVPGAYFNDFTGNLRGSARVQRGTARFPTALIFDAPHTHIVDGGNHLYEGTNFIQRLVNSNVNETLRAAIEGGRPAFENLVKRTRRQIERRRQRRLVR